jgi:pyruvate dehydrogenase kinase 2/3/4
MAAQPLHGMVSGLARAAVRAAAATQSALKQGARLADSVSREVVDDIFAHALKKQTGVSLKYMLDFGSNPIERQLLLSAQFLHRELPVRLAHRVAELENLPYGLSCKPSVLKVS